MPSLPVSNSNDGPAGALRDWARRGRYVLSEHVVRSIMGGGVTVPEIEAVLIGGKLLEEHRQPGRAASYLFCGIVRGKPVHVIAAAAKDWLVATFAYVPGSPLWLDPRRRADQGNGGSMSKPLSNCFFCGGDIKSVTVGNFDYRLEGKLYVIKKVPAGLCQQCGEKYLEATVGRTLNVLIAERKFTATEEVQVIEFQ